MGKLTETANLPQVVLIGDTDDRLLQSLLMNESSALKQRNELLLDTKYYTARVKLQSLKTMGAIHEWSASTSNWNVGAVIYNYEGEFRSLGRLEEQMTAWEADVQVAVCERLEHSSDWAQKLFQKCVTERIELIELDPSEESKADLNECYELYGISRIRQVLEAANWNNKIMKKNPFDTAEQQRCVENISNKKSSEDFCDDEELKFDDSDITEEDKEMIMKLFGGPKVSFANLVEEADSVDPAVIEHFKREMEELKRQNRLEAKKRRKKKKLEAAAANEFGEFVGADSSTQTSSNVVTQTSSNVSSPNNGHADASANVQENSVEKTTQESSARTSTQECNSDKSKDSPGNLREDSCEMSEVARSMIGLIGSDNADQEVTELASEIGQVRTALSNMPFGPDRQNLAADTMFNLVKRIGDPDLFSGSSDDEC